MTHHPLHPSNGRTFYAKRRNRPWNKLLPDRAPAAKELGVSPYRIRRLCETGLIANAECSEGGQWLIPSSEIAKMSQNGVPPTPKSIDPDTPASPSSGTRQAKRDPNALIAKPSDDAVEAAEDSFISERELATDANQLARMRIHPLTGQSQRRL
jgi:hypothetical protein